MQGWPNADHYFRDRHPLATCGWFLRSSLPCKLLAAIKLSPFHPFISQGLDFLGRVLVCLVLPLGWTPVSQVAGLRFFWVLLNIVLLSSISERAFPRSVPGLEKEVGNFGGAF